jgi:protein TonB
MAFVDLGKYSSRKAVSVTGVVLVHVALGYAFVNGLAYQVITEKFKVFIGEQIEAPKPPPPIPPKGPVNKQPLPEPLPQPNPIPFPGPTGPILGPDWSPSSPLPSDPLPAPQPPSLSRHLQAKGDRSAWVTAEDYPAASVRSNEEGRVEITVRVGINGRVTNCEVTGSSGHPALDEATCRNYAKRARFAPALAADGAPIEASYVDRVRWQLPTE